MRFKLLISFFLLLMCLEISPTLGQNHDIDSLKNCIRTEKRDTVLSKLYFVLGCNLEEVDDSVGAMKSFQTSLYYSKKSNFKRLEGHLYSWYGTMLMKAGNYDSSLVWINKGLALLEHTNAYLDLSSLYTNKGNVYYFKARYNEAMQCFITGLRIAEAHNLKSKIGALLANISVVYFDQKRFDEALVYCKKAISYYQINNAPNKIVSAYNNLGLIYYEKGLSKKDDRYVDTALFYYLKVVNHEGEFYEPSSHSTALGNVGNVYTQKGDIPKALKYYELAVKEKEEMNDRDGLSFEYSNIGQALIDLKRTKEGIKYLEKGYNISVEIESLDGIAGNAEYLADAYEQLGDKGKALYYYKIFKQFNDSIFNSDNIEERTQLMLSYEFNKKEELAKIAQDKKDAIKEEQLKQQRLMVYLSIFILLVVAIFVYFLFKANSKNKKANILLSAQKSQIEQANEELNQQNEEIAAQRDQIENQKHKVEIQHQEIKDSILYAKRIQQALLTSDEYVSQYLKEHFILFKPKDIVSGDFYWIFAQPESTENIMLTAADCTGHGVPGAFMSMMGINFLNEIVVEKKITQPNLILNELRSMIISALNPKGSEVESKDGMDVVLCNLNTETLQLSFAAANNPLYIIRNSEIVVHKADKFPVGKYNDVIKDFALQQVQLQKGDLVYLFSDGYADQFGGPKGKKFKYKQLQELLLNIADKPLIAQKEILNQSFENWRGNNEQVDDVLVIGVRV